MLLVPVFLHLRWTDLVAVIFWTRRVCLAAAPGWSLCFFFILSPFNCPWVGEKFYLFLSLTF